MTLHMLKQFLSPETNSVFRTLLLLIKKNYGTSAMGSFIPSLSLYVVISLSKSVDMVFCVIQKVPKPFKHKCFKMVLGQLWCMCILKLEYIPKIYTFTRRSCQSIHQPHLPYALHAPVFTFADVATTKPRRWRRFSQHGCVLQFTPNEAFASGSCSGVNHLHRVRWKM